MNTVTTRLMQLWDKWPKCLRDQNVSAKIDRKVSAIKNSFKDIENFHKLPENPANLSHLERIFLIGKTHGRLFLRKILIPIWVRLHFCLSWYILESCTF